MICRCNTHQVLHGKGLQQIPIVSYRTLTKQMQVLIKLFAKSLSTHKYRNINIFKSSENYTKISINQIFHRMKFAIVGCAVCTFSHIYNQILNCMKICKLLTLIC